MKILVTGAAGFIGFHLSERLLKLGHHVVGIDNLNNYYSVQLKHDRLERLSPHTNFTFVQCDFAEPAKLQALFNNHIFERVIHLGAQAGVRHSIENPQAYSASNLSGFVNILEACRHANTPHLIYASSSSVYGANAKQPFSESHNVDHPVSLYAATKKANELMAHTYSSLYGLPTTGLRFFTVYGPWGRPDMAYFKFVDKIFAGESIDVYNHGNMQRDFTYIDDIIESLVRIINTIPTPNHNFDKNKFDPSSSYAPYRVFNIGNNSPVDLMKFIETIEHCLGRTAKKNLLPMQDGDVPLTYADVSKLTAVTGFNK